jgi:hypothetical protein
MKKDIYLIHPVANQTKEEKQFLDDYVSRIESNGKKVHYPSRDVDQNDPIGLRICSEHRDAMKEVKAAHWFYNPTSRGSVFDMGMAYMAKKELLVVNPNDVKEEQNFMLNFIRSYALNMDGMDKNLIKKIFQKQIEINTKDILEITWNGFDMENVFYFGMAFMAEKPIRLTNQREVRSTPKKSYENVLLKLDDLRLENSI